MNKVLNRIKDLFLEVLPAFIFFLVMFHIMMITRALVLKQYGISAPASAVAVIGALIVAKVILIANRIPFLNIYPKKPLIWNVLLKAVVFSAITFVFLIVEGILQEARRQGGLVAGFEHFGANVVWPAFWARDIWINVLILFYCAAMELAHVVGAKKMSEIFFGKR
jgi:hypothetical protein